ncbi:MAG: heme exporter protein CcmD [Alphaproteobacteria bacterium]|nr:heme exporter protein CcmD [Alphaproteobacteria bacterium]
MSGIEDLLYLGGYGKFVWPAFATAVVVLAWMAVSTLRRLRANESELDRLQEAQGRVRRPAEAGEEAGP